MNGGTLNFLASYISSILESFQLFWGPVVEEESPTFRGFEGFRVAASGLGFKNRMALIIRTGFWGPLH